MKEEVYPQAKDSLDKGSVPGQGFVLQDLVSKLVPKQLFRPLPIGGTQSLSLLSMLPAQETGQTLHSCQSSQNPSTEENK